MTNILNAINKKYQSRINQVYNADRKYNYLVNLQDGRHDITEAQESAIERKQETAFNKLQNLWDTLPKREQNNANKQYFNIHGYTIV